MQVTQNELIEKRKHVKHMQIGYNCIFKFVNLFRPLKMNHATTVLISDNGKLSSLHSLDPKANSAKTLLFIYYASGQI